MTTKEIYKYALKGIAAEIEQLEKEVKQGRKLIEQIDNGEKVKTTKTKFEILDIVNEKKEQIEKLEKEKFTISWQIEVEMQDEN